MTNDGKKRKGTFGRVIDAIVAWENAMNYTLRLPPGSRPQSRARSLVGERRTESVTRAQ